MNLFARIRRALAISEPQRVVVNPVRPIDWPTPTDWRAWLKYDTPAWERLNRPHPILCSRRPRTPRELPAFLRKQAC